MVCTAWGGLKDVIRASETGYFMDAVMTKHGIRVDWATGAQRVIELLTTPTLHRQMQRQAQIWTRQRFSNTAVVELLAPIVSAHRQDGLGTLPEQPAYTPSAFAHRYEAHKRRCCWYATGEQLRRRWYPRMFQLTAIVLDKPHCRHYPAPILCDITRSAPLVQPLFQPGFDGRPLGIDDAEERDIPRALVRRVHILAQGAFACGANAQQRPARWLILAVGLELHALAVRLLKAEQIGGQIACA